MEPGSTCIPVHFLVAGLALCLIVLLLLYFELYRRRKLRGSG